MKTYIAFLLFFALSVQIQAQNFAAGLEFEDERYDQLNRQPEYSGTKDINLPLKVDLSPYCPEVGNQGSIFSCVGWAVGYGAMTIQDAINSNCTNKKRITEQAYSALFIYNQIKEGNCKSGARLSDAMEFLRSKGDCRAGEFDIEIENCDRQPAAALLSKAKRDTISDYLTLFAADEKPERKILKVRKALAQKRPVIIGMSIRQSFFQLHKAQYWWPELGNTAPAGGHALIVAGYDDQTQSFLLFNSWGKQWGDNGYIRLKYEEFGNYCKYAYILHREKTPKSKANSNENKAVAVAATTIHPLQELSGNCQLKHLDGFSSTGEEPIFKNSVMHGQQGVYRLEHKWPIGQLFQLEAYASQKDLYLYVFSVDATGKTNIHWPRKGNLNPKFVRQNESALITEANAGTIVPGRDKALKLAHAEEDVIYILFSNKKIRGIHFISKQLSQVKENHLQALQSLMGQHLIPSAEINYEKQSLEFQARTRSTGYIVPLILIVEGAF